ncbi:hypothetical protein RS1P1_50140 [Pseudomonas moraviensis]|nr:hypothetical protein RS1P1_50140 [Pseudomonas moraviensis]
MNVQICAVGQTLMTGQKTLEYFPQQRRGKASLFERIECQVQPRHVNTARFTIIKAHASVYFGTEALAFKQNG